jgi:hypothetical protein
VPSDLEIPQPSYRNARREAAAMDPATKRLALIAGGLGGALVLILGAWLTIGHHHGGVPLITADPHPIRVKPENPGGMQVVGANEDVMNSAGDGSDKVAPAPETPQIQQLQAQIQAAKTAEAAAVPPPSAPQPAPLPQAVAPQPAAPIAGAPAPAATPSGKPMQQAANAVPPLAVQPRQVTLPAAPAAHAGGTQVQLAALGSEQAAHAEWDRLAKKAPTLLNGRSPAIERAEVDGKTVFRLRTGGFGSIADATEFCGQMRAKGAACSIAAF